MLGPLALALGLGALLVASGGSSKKSSNASQKGASPGTMPEGMTADEWGKMQVGQQEKEFNSMSAADFAKMTSDFEKHLAEAQAHPTGKPVT